MIEQMQPSLISTALFVLLFMLIFYLFERYKISIQAFWAKQSLPGKIPWDTTRKIIFLWVGILVARKLIYYVPYPGIIQTTSSVWWVDTNVLTFLYFLFFLFLLAVTLIGIAVAFKANPSERIERDFVQTLVVLFVLGVGFTLFKPHEFSQEPMPLVKIILTPLLMLKMICTGKYLGLLTSLGMGYFIFNRYKKLKPGITQTNMKFLALPVLIFFVFLFIGYAHFTGDGKAEILHKLETAKSPKAFEDLVEAAHSIKDNLYKSSVLRNTAMVIAKNGDTSWAISIAKGIPDMKIKDNTLSEIQQRMEKK
ncbi:MAG: hypothetical protein PVH61_30065 [Candidatus Aminicenantes bacterium]|jgi:hypothetical protein